MKYKQVAKKHLKIKHRYIQTIWRNKNDKQSNFSR